MANDLNVEGAVAERYGEAAKAVEPALCCPVDYNPEFLKVLPDEIVERDYGCGDPSAFVREGETVLDLGSGGGKICYIAAQIVGSEGKVIGIDTNAEMLELSRKYLDEMSARLGYANVAFLNGKIQDLRTDRDALDGFLKSNPVSDINTLAEFEEFSAKQKAVSPLVADESIDVVISNCVLNLVRNEEKAQMFDEMFRVLKVGGRAAISDIVSDEDIPEHLRNDSDMWSGCISGAYREDQFLKAFEDAGFYGIEIVKRDETPWRTVEGIEFRSVTVLAYKGKQGKCLERNQAVVYRGPWRKVYDDDGHYFERGVRMAVCDKTFKLLQKEPYEGEMIPISPLEDIPLEQAGDYRRNKNSVRSPRETKGAGYDATTDESCCGDTGCC
ncbi:MAG: methyltransferase domain-containing protein [Pyrinomonadaceae bacterium]